MGRGITSTRGNDMPTDYVSPALSLSRLERYRFALEVWLNGLSEAEFEDVLTRVRAGELLGPEA